jgi:hypothetical protein
MVLSHPNRNIVLPLVITGGCGVFIASWRMLSTCLLKTDSLSASIRNLADRAGPSWFMWHPLFAIVGTLLLPVPGVILRKYKGYWSKKIHGYVFATSLLCTFASLYFIFQAKEAKARPHLTTVHAWAGLALSVGYTALAAAGIFGLDPDHAVLQKNTPRERFVKWIHKSGGRVLLVGGYWVCFSGWYKFFNKEGSMYAGALVALTASLLTYIDPIVSEYQRRAEKKLKE